MELKFSRCTHTGLLYVNEVPFTRERITMVLEVMKYADQNNKQFEHSITITDTAHDERFSVTIDKTNYKDFLIGIGSHNLSSICNDEDWTDDNEKTVFNIHKDREPNESGNVFIPIENDFEIDDKSIPAEFLNNVDWTPDEKTIIKVIINRLGTGDHPTCNEKTFNRFYKSYLFDIMSEESFDSTIEKHLSPFAILVVNQIKNKLGIV